MSKFKVSRTATAATVDKKTTKVWPVVVYVWTIGLALMSYVVARVVLYTYPHPYHWGTAIVGGVAGIGIGWLWYRWRGDVF